MKINDLNPYPLGPTPKTPAAGNLFTDPAFGTAILRVTDETDAAGAMFVNGYSAIFDTFNSDSSRIVYLDLPGGGGWTAQLDVVAKKVTNKRRLAKYGSNAAGYWSRLSPDVFYVVEQWNAANLWRYHFPTDTWELVADLSKLLPPQQPGTNWCGSRGMSWDDNRFHIQSGASNYIYDVKQAKFIGQFTLAQAQAAGWNPTDAATLFAKSTMDSAGAALWTADTEFIYNVETGASFLPGFGVEGNQYGDVHADAGFGNVVGTLGGLGAASPKNPDGSLIEGVYPLLFRIDPANLASYLQPRRQLGPRFLWGLDSHTSYRDKTGAWVNFNLDGTPSGIDAGKVPIFGNQCIFQFNYNTPADGSVNRRIAQSYSDPSTVPSNLSFWAQPEACQAQDNRAVAFRSTYGNQRIDLYIAFLDLPAPPLTDDTLAGIQFTTAEAQVLKTFAQWQLSTRPKPVL